MMMELSIRKLDNFAKKGNIQTVLRKVTYNRYSATKNKSNLARHYIQYKII